MTVDKPYVFDYSDLNSNDVLFFDLRESFFYYFLFNDNCILLICTFCISLAQKSRLIGDKALLSFSSHTETN